MRSCTTRWGLFSVVIALALPFYSPAFADDAPSPVTVDLVREDDYQKSIVLFRAKINNTDGLFLLDSGSVTFSAMTAAFAKRSGIPTEEGKEVSYPLEIGSFKTSALSFTVTGRPEKIGEGSEKKDFEKIDGIIGWNLFEACKIMIDFPAAKITFGPLTDEKAVGVEGKSAVVPFEYLQSSSGKPIRGIFVTGEIETKEGKKKEIIFCIDTACNSTIVDLETTKELALPKVNFFMDTASGKKYDIVQAASVRLPGLRWRNCNMVTYTHGQLQLLRKESGKHVVGLIGTWILQRYIVTFDYRNKQVTFLVPEKKK